VNDPEGTRIGGPVGLISNPASGHNRDQFDRLRERIEASPTILHRVTRSAAEIRPALEEFAARGIGLLAINGGDGTGSAVLGELLESGLFPDPPAVALLPGGTANMNAGDVGVRGALRGAVARFCSWCDGARDSRELLQRRSLLRLSPADGDPPRYGMFLGAGAVISGTEYAHRELHARGLRDDFSLALGTLRTGWGLLRGDPAFRRPVPLSLAMDGGEPRQFEALILAVSTLHRLAFGMRPFWGDGPGAVRLTLIDRDCTRFASTFASILRGRPNRNAVPRQGYHSHNAGHLALELTGALNLDGEVFTPTGPLLLEASRELAFLRL
jgi:hypothetical protein